MADYATLLRDRVTLTCRSIDRIFLQAYVPKLQSVGQVCLFLISNLWANSKSAEKASLLLLTLARQSPGRY
jgi:hypothetical protein